MLPGFFARLLSRHRDGRRFDLKLQAEAYRLIPQLALTDLAEFCFAAEPAPDGADALTLARMAGRRDVWLRITGHRTIRDDEVIALLRGEIIAQPKEKSFAGMV